MSQDIVKTKEVKRNIELYTSINPSNQKEIDNASLLINSYFKNNCMVGDFDSVPQKLKIALLMNLPVSFLKERVIGKDKQGKNVKAKYLPHTIANKCLNLIFSHDWSYELVHHSIEEVKVGNSRAYHVIAVANFEAWLQRDDGTRKQIKRTVSSGTMHYVSAATNKGHALMSAISKCKTVFLKQMDIGSNLEKAESRGYESAKKRLSFFASDDIDTEGFEATK